jgi:hypothetical protein
MSYFCNPNIERWYTGSGRSVARLSRLLWEQEVASSNLAAPTTKKKEIKKLISFFFVVYLVCSIQEYGKNQHKKFCGYKGDGL